MSEHINNSTRRKEKLKEIVWRLHEGAGVDAVKDEFAALIKETGATEIAEVEQALIDDGVPESEVKQLCDVHVALFRETLDAQAPPAVSPGHPVHTFHQENIAAGQVLDALEAAIGAARWKEARERLHELLEYEKHYLRKENILFPYLEKHGFPGPSSVMWAIHDDVRAGWKELGKALARKPDPTRVAEVFEPLSTAIREMFYKEENILYPAAVERLSAEEWAEIRAQEPEIGLCYVEPRDARSPGAAPQPATAAPVEARAVAGMVPLNTGGLTPEQIDLLLTHLPVDVTFVDENDEVRFFSQTKERIFPRSPAIIGRKVQKCHPPDSVHRVQQIVDDLRSGRRDEAEFWIQLGARFVHIRYFAVRDEAGTYRGTIEVSQDVAPIRALEGEKRLLDEE